MKGDTLVRSFRVLLVLVPLALAGCATQGGFGGPGGGVAPAGKFRPRALLGHSERQLAGLLGEPKSVREEPPAKVWQYVGASCRLDVFFYFDITSKEFRSLDYKIYGKNITPEKKAECLERLRAAVAADKRDRH